MCTDLIAVQKHKELIETEEYMKKFLIIASMLCMVALMSACSSDDDDCDCDEEVEVEVVE